MANLLLALDQGTTSSRAILFDTAGRQIAVAQRELPQIFTQPGWVEHSPLDIWQTQLETAREVIAAAGAGGGGKIAVAGAAGGGRRAAAGAEGRGKIVAIGITNQRETTVLWERATGRPLHNAIVWQDRRTADVCTRLKQSHLAQIQGKTGLVPDAYFSASKLQWLLDNIPGARERAGRGELAFGTVDTWLLWNLTQGRVHATDVSNASRTMLFNIHNSAWDNDLLALFDIPRELLPEVRDSAGLFGETTLLGGTIPITGIAGDQQAALFGQNCVTSGLAKNTYGTGCFLLQNIGEKAAVSKNQLLTTIAWRLPQAGITYALEGSVFIGGAVVQWLRDGLGIIKSSADIEALAASTPDSGGVYIVPAFAGLGAPHWDPYARGTIAGITRGTTAAHFARAALEAIAFQVADLLEVMHADAHAPIHQLRVDGGASRNDLLLQFQADLLQIPVLRPQVTETTALGAALLAGLGAGVFGKVADLQAIWRPGAEFRPKMGADEAGRRRRRWRAALERARDWEECGP